MRFGSERFGGEKFIEEGRGGKRRGERSAQWFPV